MPGLLWSHLPIIWLMLSRLLQEGSLQWMKDEKIKICGNVLDEYVLTYCLEPEKVLFKIQMDQLEGSGSLTKTVPSSTDKDADAFAMPSTPRDSVFEVQPPFWEDLFVQGNDTIDAIVKLCCKEGCDKKTFLQLCTLGK